VDGMVAETSKDSDDGLEAALQSAGDSSTPCVFLVPYVCSPALLVASLVCRMYHHPDGPCLPHDPHPCALNFPLHS
jgi:hypothetical protein